MGRKTLACWAVVFIDLQRSGRTSSLRMGGSGMRRSRLASRTCRLHVSLLLFSIVLTLGFVQAASASEVEGWHWDYGPIYTVHKANDLCAPDALHAWVVGDGGFIVATSDGGATWKEQDSGTLMNLNAVSFPDAMHGWIVGGGTNILATTDGGITWGVLTSNNTTGFSEVDFVDTLHGWGLMTGLGISRTTDGGTTWTMTEIPRVFPSDMDFADSTHGWAVGRRYDQATGTYPDCILSTTDGGVTWNVRDTGTYVTLTAVDFCDATHGWAVGNEDTVFATDDGGLTWDARPTGTGVYWRAVSFPDASHGWVAGYQGTILATSDGGATWSVQPYTYPPPEDSLSFTDIVFPDAGHGWALHYNEIFHTTNGGAPSVPTLTSFSPAAGPPNSVVTLKGNYRFGASAVTFDGVTAAFSWDGAGRVTARVPRAATTGRITVTTPGGTVTSSTDFTVLVKPALTLRVAGLTNGVLQLGKRFTAKGTVAPRTIDGGPVKLALQRYRSGAWRKVTSVTKTIRAGGAYSWTYRPGARGSYRIRATMAKTLTYTAASTTWKKFRAK